MKLTGFTDEASSDIDDQIRVTKELGWDYISLRTVGTKNIHDISDADFDAVCEKLDQNDIKVAEFGTLIGNWSKSIHSNWSITEDEVERCIERMKVLNVRIARIMSYSQEPWGEDQFVDERVKRLQKIVDYFESAGLTAVHENCMNYGGFSADHTLELVEKIPNLKLVFDTGNPIFQKDRSKSEPYPWQDSWEFYEKVKKNIAHIHVKDAIIKNDEPEYVFAGQGNGYVHEIIEDLFKSDYKGYVAIEPHMGKVFHEDFSSKNASKEYDIYKEYGIRFEKLIQSI